MERVHRMCYYLKKRDFTQSGRKRPKEPIRCKECPALETVGKHSGTKMCRLLAQECLNVAQTGNPWRKRRMKWPVTPVTNGSSDA